MMLSILIPSIPSRHHQFARLTMALGIQILEIKENHPSLGDVEFLCDPRKSFLHGGLSIGKKREGLVKRANGKYLCFLDDDEDIAPNYVETLVRLCQQDKDVVTFRNISKMDNYWTVIDMSLEFDNEEANPDGIVNRSPWHICPVKSEYAKLYDFEDISYGEDWKWFSKVLTHCKTEAKTNQILHCYNYSSKWSEADKIVKHERA